MSKLVRQNGFVLTRLPAIPFFLAQIALMSASSLAQDTKASSGEITREAIIASIRVSHFDENLAFNEMKGRSQYINKLLSIFKNSKATDMQKLAAAFYLGEMRASEAVDELAANLKLQRPLTMPITHIISPIRPSVAAALVKIGTPSIPAMIKNLQESDDADIRELSLAVLSSIEADNDIVTLRLQKALDAQTDATVKARLRTAIKLLPEVKLVEPGPHLGCRTRTTPWPPSK